MIKEDRVGSNTILLNVPKPITKAKLIEFLNDRPDDSEIIVHVEGNIPRFNYSQGKLMKLAMEISKKGTTIGLIGWAQENLEFQNEL